MQAGYPVFCKHDSSRVQSLDIPALPDNFNDLSDGKKAQAIIKQRLEEMNLYYTAATGIHNEQHLKALRTPFLSMRKYLTQQTGYPWDADVINLRAALVGITSSIVWSRISPFRCPMSIYQEERERSIEESSEWNESEALLSRVRMILGSMKKGVQLQRILNGLLAEMQNLAWRCYGTARINSVTYVGEIGPSKTMKTILHQRHHMLSSS